MRGVFLQVLAIAGGFFLTGWNIVNGQGNQLKYENSSVYAGIEVGTASIRLSIVELSKNVRYNASFHEMLDSSITTGFTSFTQPSFQATLDGLCNFYSIAVRDYKIPSRSVFTVVSSNVKAQAEKENKTTWVRDLIDSFRLRVKEKKREVKIVDTLEEARLSHLGIVPEDRRFSTLLINISDSSSSGGYFPYGTVSNFKLISLHWGTRNMAGEAEKRCGEDDRSIENYQKQLYKVLFAAENLDIIYAINASGAYSMMDNIAFSGGIAWALATLMHPELADKSVVPVTIDEIIRFSEQLYRNYPSLWAEKISSHITDEMVNKADLINNIKLVHTTFDQRSLMAGTGLMLKIMRQFVSVSDGKQFYLVRNGQAAWIPARVNESSTE